MRKSSQTALLVLIAAGAIAAGSLLVRVAPRPTQDPPATSAAPQPLAAPSASTVPVPDPSASAPPAPAPLPKSVRVDPDSARVCGPRMLLVDGLYCPYVGHFCEEFAIEERDVCARYGPEVLCEGRLERRRFCIDEFEYPNIAGALPVVMADFADAQRGCAVEGKRLCTVEEWEFACEGTVMWPYPYGLRRDPTACNIDRPWTEPDLPAYSDPWKISSEVDRLDKRVASGSMDRCVSPFGVRDMTGNVDEWVLNTHGKIAEKPFRSTLKGGYWGPIRARCRPITSTHNEWFRFYQIGFRCCSDTPGTPARSAPPAGAKLPRRRPMEAPDAAR